MYGPKPKRITEKLLKVPPVNKLTKPNNWLEEKSSANLTLSIPGIGIDEANLKITSMPKIKNIFFLRSGILKICRNLFMLILSMSPDVTSG